MSHIKNKQARARFDALVKKIAQNTIVDYYENEKAKRERLTRAKKDYAFFVSYYFPHLAKASCASFQLDNAKKIKNNPRCKAIIQWARGHAKTTHFCIFLPLWLKIQENRDFNFMVMVAKNRDLAISQLSNIQAELGHNARYIHDFGEQMQHGSWEEGKFTTTDNCSFIAFGRGQSPRGLLHKGNRPDYIVLDDVDDDEIVLNPKRMRKLEDWCLEALFPTMSYGRGRFIVVGNKIHKESLIARLEKNQEFKTTIINALDKKGLPAWPENYSIDEIHAMIRVMGERRANKELFNNPASGDGNVFMEKDMQFKPTLPLHRYAQLVSYCDPSFKASATADYKAVVLVGRTKNEFHILDCLVQRCSVRQMANFMFDINEQIPPSATCEFWMEANFAQDLLLQEFEEIEKSRGLLLLRKDLRKKPDKFGRIENLSPLFERKLVFFNKKNEHKTDFITLQDQLLSFEKGSRNPDDGPDALEGAIYLLNKGRAFAGNHYRIGGLKNNYKW